MKYHLVLLCFAIVFSLFFIKAAYSDFVPSAKYDDPNSHTVYIVKQVFELWCNASEDVTIRWEKSGQQLNASDPKQQRFVFKNPSPNVYTISTNKANEEDAGTYSCVAYNKDDRKEGSTEIQVVQEVHVKVPTNINVVEGEKLKIECQTIGKPTIHWTYRPEGAPEKNATIMVESERVNFTVGESKLPMSVLEVVGITEADRGIYTCKAQATTGKLVEASCTVRVKGRYAALWPFLGICVEVFVLCLIIFIYEKKRNKTELEESDTDQSPDQKNTPDHGKDSNLRHRQ